MMAIALTCADGIYSGTRRKPDLTARAAVTNHATILPAPGPARQPPHLG